MLASLTAWWKSSKYVIFAIIAVAAAILGFVLRGMFTSPHDNVPVKVEPPDALKKKVEQAQDDALAARAAAKARTDEQKASVSQIMKESDGAARRKRLAQWVANQ